jgi:hypothetical protein
MHSPEPFRFQRLARLAHHARLACLACVTALGASTAMADDVNHPGPVIVASIVRGAQRLPIYQVARLRKGDLLQVSADKTRKDEGKWLLILATVSPAGNRVSLNKFDLSASGAPASIEIGSDDAVPLVILAPQLRTLFGLSTSFEQSAALINDAITADPQRFVELQKIDEIDLAINNLSSSLNAAVRSQDPAHAVAAAKSMAARFGVKNVDPACFKDDVVNTKCVANSIVSNKDLTLPALSDLGALAGPFAAADLSPDLLANVRLFSAASSFLANKYQDRYDFAPSLGRRHNGTDALQLYSSARFRNADVKTAYVYVPSWFTGAMPELSASGPGPLCLGRGELAVSLSHSLPVSNYWHDWELLLRRPGASTPLARATELRFEPSKGLFAFDFARLGHGMLMDGRPLEASISGKFGFDTLAPITFKVVLPRSDGLADQITGLDQLVAGERASITAAAAAGACIEALELRAAGAALGASSAQRRDRLDLDLGAGAAGAALLKVRQYGLEAQQIAVRIAPRRAHVTRIEHHDLDLELRVHGDNLERIDRLSAGADDCLPAATDGAATDGAAPRRFVCPPRLAANAELPAKLRVTHLDQTPAGFDAALTKLGPRPQLQVIGARTPLRTVLSPKARQWGLGAADHLLTEDSGLSLLLRAADGYRLAAGSYNLQLKFADDPLTEQKPVSVSLMADRTHNELRTRTPVSFADRPLPAVINPLWYRVQHQQSGFVGDWQSLGRAVVTLPTLGALSCGAGGLLLHGVGLDQIDWVSADLERRAAPLNWKPGDAAPFGACDQGPCIAVAQLGADQRLRMKVHWIDQPLFDVRFEDAPNCPTSQ